VTSITLRLPREHRICQVTITIYTRWPFLDCRPTPKRPCAPSEVRPIIGYYAPQQRVYVIVAIAARRPGGIHLWLLERYEHVAMSPISENAPYTHWGE
jgi:hypothetical protein